MSVRKCWLNMTERDEQVPFVVEGGHGMGLGRQQQQVFESYSHHSYPSLCPSFSPPLLPSTLLSPSPLPLVEELPNLVLLSLKCINLNLNLHGSTGMKGSSRLCPTPGRRNKFLRGEFARDWEREDGDSMPVIGGMSLAGDP